MSASFTTYYETGSLRDGTWQPHKKAHHSRQAASREAAALSKTTGGFVTVARNGLEIASYLHGRRMGGEGGVQHFCESCGKHFNSKGAFASHQKYKHPRIG